MSCLPPTTVRDLAAVAIVVTELAWIGTKRALSWLKPLASPPSDLRVTSIRGDEYTGLVVIEANTVRAGIVVRVGGKHGAGQSGSGPPGGSSSSWPRSTSSGSSAYGSDDDDNDCRLPSWADDSREEDAWYPRSQRR